MLHVRNVTIKLMEEFVDAVGGMPNKHVSEAVGYLSLWAIASERYCNVVIVGDKDGNLSAGYADKDGNSTYSLFGLKNENGYSFHS